MHKRHLSEKCKISMRAVSSVQKDAAENQAEKSKTKQLLHTPDMRT